MRCQNIFPLRTHLPSTVGNVQSTRASSRVAHSQRVGEYIPVIKIIITYQQIKKVQIKYSWVRRESEHVLLKKCAEVLI